jgi:tetratricopeptide (TPR) repeat protein
VSVDGGGFHNPETAAHYVELSERFLQELEREIDHRSGDISRLAYRHRRGLAVRIAETREVLDELRARFPEPPTPDPGPLAALPTLRDGWTHAAEGRIPEAVAAYEKALELDPALSPSAAVWSVLCQSGFLGHPAAVLEACDRGVALAPGYPGLQNARGVARALTGDLEGASADLEAHLDTPWIVDRGRRQEWIGALERGDNPFAPEVLAELGGR